ncbi:MAG: haloacid dehalogenase [Acidimicrobiia bacterium]|nr:MAG: haloacid dehalogenase [Acidimicrobiia bacterium]
MPTRPAYHLAWKSQPLTRVKPLDATVRTWLAGPMVLLMDIGGVLIKTPFELLDAVGNPPWHGPFDPEADPLWRDVVEGRLSERDYWDARARSLGGLDPRDPIGHLFRILFDRPEDEVVRPEVAGLVRSVERTAALTNDLIRFHGRRWVERMHIFRLFDPMIDLSFDRHRKPAPQAFEKALRALEVEPDAVLYVDDQPANVTAARAAGMDAVLFDVTDPGASVRLLERRVRG